MEGPAEFADLSSNTAASLEGMRIEFSAAERTEQLSEVEAEISRRQNIFLGDGFKENYPAAYELISNSPTLRFNIARAYDAGYRLEMDFSKSSKPGAIASYTEQSKKRIFIFQKDTKTESALVNAIMFEISNVFHLEDMEAVSKEVRQGYSAVNERNEVIGDGGKAENPMKAGDYSRRIASIEIEGRFATNELMLKAQEELHKRGLGLEFRASTFSKEYFTKAHLHTVVQGNATVAETYMATFYHNAIPELEKRLEKLTQQRREWAQKRENAGKPNPYKKLIERLNELHKTFKAELKILEAKMASQPSVRRQ